MGQIVPRSLLEKMQVTTKLKTLEEEIIALAARETNTRPDEWVVRDALPATDFGFADERWVNQRATLLNAWQSDWVLPNYNGVQLPVNKYAVFYGINQNPLNPTIYGIRFRQGRTGATTIDTIQFRKVLEEDNVIGFFDRIIYRPQSVIWIDLIANAVTAINTEEFEILTLICEKYGDVVSGSKSII